MEIIKREIAAGVAYLGSSPSLFTHHAPRTTFRFSRITFHASRTLPELHIPIRQINKMLPTVVLGQAEADLDERPPLGPLGFADQVHVRFLRRAIRLERIAFNAGTDDVLPCCRSAAVAWNHMVQIQILAVAGLAAILAGILVALEN